MPLEEFHPLIVDVLLPQSAHMASVIRHMYLTYKNNPEMKGYILY